MLKLIRLEDGRLCVLENGVYAVGTAAEAIDYLTTTVGIDPNEIRIALEDMDRNGTNVADFGIQGIFIFSERKLIDMTLFAKAGAA